MEKELNIAAILKEKPRVKVWSDTLGELVLAEINKDKYCPINLTDKNGMFVRLTKEGYYHVDKKGLLPCIVPSKRMRDWSKFAWKKGDVLKSPNYLVIFDKWNNDDYTSFIASFGCCRNIDYGKGDAFYTSEFNKVSNEEAKEFIKKVEEHYGGKLNLSTLEIEQPKQEFNDGDILVMDETKYNFYAKCIFIIRKNISYIDENTHYYVFLNLHYGDLSFNNILYDDRTSRLATDSEKQQLFSALEKEGKAWDAEKKMLVDLPKKCEFEPMDWCLMRDIKEKWKLCQFGFCDKEDEYEASYNAVGGNWYNECIPYNNSTKHLLGTTDEWKGGEG